MTIPDTLLDRFFDALVWEIRASRPAYLQSSFTVAEIYQNLVPYRTHRDVIGAEINGDYEDALLRLLAGEGEFLELESEAARKRIQDELRSSNPNTTIYREFAAAEVRLHRGRARMLAAADTGERTDVHPASDRVEVGWGHEEATPVSGSSSRESGVNPDLGLFVSDLFGGGGEEMPGGDAEPASTPSPEGGAAREMGTSGESAGEEGEAPDTAAPPEDEVPLPPTPVAQDGGTTPVPLPGARAAGPIPLPPPVAPAPVSAPVREAPAPVSTPSIPPTPSWSVTPSPAIRSGREGDGALAQVEDENRRLRRIVADQALEILRLKDLLDRS